MTKGHIPQIGLLTGGESDIGILNADITGIIKPSNGEVRYYPGEPIISSLDIFKDIFIPVQKKANSHGLHAAVAIKVYEETPHGKTDFTEVCLWLPPSTLDASFKPGMNLAISGVMKIDQELFFIPTLDLEYPINEKYFSEIALQKLIGMGLSGNIIKSGYSHHFIGNSFYAYDKNFWRIMGLFMQNLVYDEDLFKTEVDLSKSFGKQLLNAESLEECSTIADAILRVYPSLLSGQMRDGLLYDPRWIAHRLQPLRVEFDLLAINTIRVLKGKGYDKPPIFEGEILVSE